MTSRKYPDPASVVEPNYFSNWGDLWYPKLANRLLKPASRIERLTPNMVTITSFVLYTLVRIMRGSPDEPKRGRFAALLRTSPVFARMAAQSVNRHIEPGAKDASGGEDKPEKSR